MSVLIKNMQMPKSCKTCDLIQDYDGDMYCPLGDCPVFGDIKYVPNHVASDICPLIELPEHHGRLIDADAVINKYGEWYTEEGSEEGFIGTIKDIINLVPTVIKSE